MTTPSLLSSGTPLAILGELQKWYALSVLSRQEKKPNPPMRHPPLKNNPKCRGLFADGVDPTDLLKSLANDNGLGAIQIGFIDKASTSAETVGITGAYYSYGGNGTFIGPTSQFIGATITINSNPLGPYMAGFPRTNDQATSRAATIIHELGHAANIIYGDGSAGIFNDVFKDDLKTGTGSIISMANTRNVMENCF